MPNWMRALAGLFLVAHGLVFLLYLVKEPDDPKWPFSFDQSWLVPVASRRSLGVVLMILTVALFVLLALAVWGVPGLAEIWPMLAVAAAVISAGLLVAFWQTQLIVGILIALALVVIAVGKPGWTDTIG